MIYNNEDIVECKEFNITLGKIPKTIVGINKLNKRKNSLLLISLIIKICGDKLPYESLLYKNIE